MKKLVKKIAENVCPKCGHREPLHGGLGWGGSSGTIRGDGYDREFGGWALMETYTCSECGEKWEVLRVEEDTNSVDPGSYRPIKGDKGGFCPYCGTDNQDDTEWVDETITSRGDKVKVEMECYKCGSWWYDMYTLDSPKISLRSPVD